jgi:hypothetical protein
MPYQLTDEAIVIHFVFAISQIGISTIQIGNFLEVYTSAK